MNEVSQFKDSSDLTILTLVVTVVGCFGLWRFAHWLLDGPTPAEPWDDAVATAIAPAVGRSIMATGNRAVSAATGQSFLDPEKQAGEQLARAVASGPGIAGSRAPDARCSGGQ